MIVDELIAEIGVASTFEGERILGLRALVSLPKELLSNSARIEIQQALDWSLARQQRLQTANTALEQLREHRYPGRFPHLIGPEIKAELANIVDEIDGAATEFAESPAAVLTVSDEVPNVG